VVGVTDPFGDIFREAGLSEFFGSGPIPPESVARGVLGIGPYLPLDRAGIKAAFRFQVKILRPDLNDTAADALRRQDAEADRTTRLAELMWARDDLLRRAPEPVTGKTVGHDPTFTRNVGEGECKGCQKTWKEGARFWNSRAWPGYCSWCVPGLENARQREKRRRARANRPCQGCTRTFTGSRSDAAYCSRACKQRAYRQRVGVVA
jgi:hypothetical protein